MRLHVLVNEGAGSVDGGDAQNQRREIHDAFAEAGAAVQVDLVPPDEICSVMRRIWDGENRPDAVVIAGGDGTVGGAAAEAAGTDLVLAVLPLGTFNHFAKDLGIPAELAAAAAALVAGEVRSIDVAEVNGRVFVNNSVLGVYPAMVAVRDRIRDQRGWGKVRAVPVAMARVGRAMPVHRLDLSGSNGFRRSRVRTPFVFVGNGVYDNEGGGLAARLAMSDGVLGVSVARAVSRWGLVRMVVTALVTGAEGARDLDQVEVTELTVSGRGRLRVAFDGEIDWFQLPLHYRVRPGALRVLAPPIPPSSEVAATP